MVWTSAQSEVYVHVLCQGCVQPLVTDRSPPAVADDDTLFFFFFVVQIHLSHFHTEAGFALLLPCAQ